MKTLTRLSTISVAVLLVTGCSSPDTTKTPPAPSPVPTTQIAEPTPTADPLAELIEMIEPSAPAEVTVVPETDAAVFYSNCKEAKAAGAAPLMEGQPGYRAELDRDRDGRACTS